MKIAATFSADHPNLEEPVSRGKENLLLESKDSQKTGMSTGMVP